MPQTSAPQTQEQSVPRAFAWTSLVVLASTGASVVQLALIAGFVGFNRESDAFYAGLIVFQLLLIVAISTRTPIVARLTADVPDSEFPALARSLMRQSINTAWIAVGGIIALIAVLGLTMILFGTRGSFNENFLAHVALFAFAGGAYIVASAISGMAFVRNQFKATSLAFVCSSLATVIATLILTPLIGVYGATLAVIASAVVLLTMHVRIYRRIVLAQPVTVPARASRRFGFAVLSSAAVAIAWQTNLFATTIKLGRDFPAGAVSVFTLSVSIVAVVLGVTAGALYNAMLPRITSGALQETASAGRDSALVLLDAMRFPALLMVPLAIWVAGLSEVGQLDLPWDKLDVLLRPDYVRVFAILLFGALPQVVITALVAIAIAKNLTRALYGCAIATCATLAVMLLALNPTSIEGIAVAVVVPYFVGAIVILLGSMREEAGFILSRYLGRVLALAAIAAAVALPAFLLLQGDDDASAVLIGGAIVVALAGYAVIASSAFSDYREMRRFLLALVAARFQRSPSV